MADLAGSHQAPVSGRLTVDQQSSVPPYEQLRQQLISQITAGELPSGTRLPSVRRLADDLGLAPNTVARTYRELEATDFVRTAGRNGTVVSPRSLDAGTLTRAHDLTTDYLTAMALLGIGEDEVVRMVRQTTASGEPRP